MARVIMALGASALAAISAAASVSNDTLVSNATRDLPIESEATALSAAMSENMTSTFRAGNITMMAHVMGGSALDVTWEDCGSKGWWPSLGKIDGFEPKSLPLGRTSPIRAWGTLSETTAGGKVNTVTKAGFLTRKWEGDLCKRETNDLPLGAGSLVWRGMNCPVAAGPVDVLADLRLSSSLPRMLLYSTVTITGTSHDGVPLFCVKMKTSPARRLASEEVEETPGFLV